MSTPAAVPLLGGERQFEKFVAAADYVNGQVIQAPTGRAAVVEGLDPEGLKTGQTIQSAVSGVFLVKKDGNAYTAGDLVEIDESAQVVVPDGDAAGDYDIGRVHKDAAAGDATVQVALNAVVDLS